MIENKIEVTLNQRYYQTTNLFLQLLERRQIEHRLFLPDVILGLVGQVLAWRLKTVDLEVDPEVEIKLVDVDQVREVQLPATRNAVDG